MNQLQAFIYFLKRMDIVKLEEILTDDIFYCGTTKAIFLQKLQAIFVWNLFLENETLPVQWSESNGNCLQFFYWKPNQYENSLLIASKDDGKIISFINKKSPNLGQHNSVLRIYKDEEIGFLKTTEFRMLQNQCKNAIHEMTEVLFTTELILNWLKKYEFIYLEIKDKNDELEYNNFKYIEEFFWLFDSKLVEQDLILNYKEAEIAILEFDKLDLLDWQIKYEHLYYCIL